MICYDPRVVARVFLFFCLVVARGQTLDDAVRTVAAKVATHLGPNETAKVLPRNISSLGPADVAKTQAGVERALRKRLRNPTAVDVLLTISENAGGFLLVAQIRQEVEMASFRVAPVAQQPAGTVEKRLLWQQEAAILDVAVIGDQMLVLDPAGVTLYDHRMPVAKAPVNITASRDPRGRLEVAGDALTIHLPGSTCRGVANPLAFTCEPGGEISAGRNTLESSLFPPHFSHARIGDEDLVAEVDGRVHVYDDARKQLGEFEGWGSDFAAVCDSTRILAAGPGDIESRDFVALYEMNNRTPVRVSVPLELPGPVTALFPGLAVTRNGSTGWYEAYSLAVDCGR